MKFKVGDKVKLKMDKIAEIENFDFYDASFWRALQEISDEEKRKLKGVVKKTGWWFDMGEKKMKIGVEWDRYIDGHDLEGGGEEGKCQYMKSYHIELVERKNKIKGRKVKK